MKSILAFALLFAVSSSAVGQDIPKDGKWIQLFNGKDLKDWHIKIQGYDLDDNFGDTFRVENGVMKVGYEKYDSFKGKFGHIHYKKPFSNYFIRTEYRFTGEQAPDGPGWALRNSGIMVHGQDPTTMRKDQDFPVSIEVQLLGGNGTDRRTTSNLCTPGTNVVMGGKLIFGHCTSSKSKTYHGEQWVTAVVEVRGDKVIKHYLDGEVVLQYDKPQLDERDPDAKKLIKNGVKLLSGGYISLQSESHPVEFRKVELMELPSK
jgi:hypothetical protein